MQTPWVTLSPKATIMMDLLSSNLLLRRVSLHLCVVVCVFVGSVGGDNLARTLEGICSWKTRLTRIIASQIFNSTDTLTLVLFIAQAPNSRINRSFSLHLELRFSKTWAVQNNPFTPILLRREHIEATFNMLESNGSNWYIVSLNRYSPIFLKINTRLRWANQEKTLKFIGLFEN